MTRDFINRIPGANVKSFDTWTIPAIEDPDKVLSSAEKEDRERKEKEARQKGEVVGEAVEGGEFGGPITAAELERITEQAHQEGYLAGFEQGQVEGLKAGSEKGQQQAYQETKQRLNEQCERLETIVSGLIDPFEKETKALHDIVLNTVLALSGSVVKRELQIDSSEISHFVELSLNALPKSAKDVVIHLHPKDVAMLEECFPDKVKQWVLVPDTDLTVGGVVVKSKDSVVDFSLENQLALLGEQYIKGELTSTVETTLETDILEEDPLTAVSSEQYSADTIQDSANKDPTKPIQPDLSEQHHNPPSENP